MKKKKINKNKRKGDRKDQWMSWSEVRSPKHYLTLPKESKENITLREKGRMILEGILGRKERER